MSTTKLVTVPMILSFPVFVTPRQRTKKDGTKTGDPKYGCTLVALAGTDPTPFKEAIMAAGQAKWGAKFAQYLESGKLELPINRDPEQREKWGYDVAAGDETFFIRCTSKSKPGAVDRYKDPATGKARYLTADEIESKLYAGARVKAELNAFTYDDESRGISFAINNIQFWEDGERLDNRTNAADAFEAEEGAEASMAGGEDEATAPVTKKKDAPLAAKSGAKSLMDMM